MTNLGDRTVSVIDTATGSAVATIPVGNDPYGVAVSRSGKAYVTNEIDNTVSVIDTANNAVTATVPVGVHPRGVAISPDGGKVLVADTRDDTVTFIDTASNTPTTTTSVGDTPLSVAFDPYGTVAYVANLGLNFGEPSIAILDADGTVDTTLDLSGVDDGVDFIPSVVIFSPDGRTAYVGSLGNSEVMVISTGIVPPTPAATTSASSAGPGDTLTVNATGFQPFEPITIELHPDAVTLATTTADGSGAASVPVTLPSNTSPGAHVIAVIGQSAGEVDVPITVIGRAATGLDAMPFVVAGSGLLLLGAAFVLIDMATRRKTA